MGQQQEFLSGQGQSGEFARYRKGAEKLKEEHPATFEDSSSPYGYQDRVTYKEERAETRARTTATGSSQRQWEVPSWAKPQERKAKKKNIWRWIVVIVLALVVIKFLIPLIIGLILALVAAAAFLILVPLLIIFALLIGLAVVAALVILGFAEKLRVHR